MRYQFVHHLNVLDLDDPQMIQLESIEHDYVRILKSQCLCVRAEVADNVQYLYVNDIDFFSRLKEIQK